MLLASFRDVRNEYDMNLLVKVAPSWPTPQCNNPNMDKPIIVNY